ncbi:MAG: TIGR00725 family protein [Calditrichaeota bacterium]|nr:TIGR00725 family protein [Calditrichota bacterium]
MAAGIIGVLGGGQCDAETYEQARRVGQEIARRGGRVVCGGLFGVMEAVCRGAREAGGTTIGILPTDQITDANPYVDIPIATGMGIGRNIIIVRTAQVCIAINGGYGTLSEIAYALQLGKPVITLNSWDDIPGVIPAATPEEAVTLAFNQLEGK